MKKKLKIIITEEFVNKNKIYVANCINLKIASQGRTKKEALKNIQDAIDLYSHEILIY